MPGNWDPAVYRDRAKGWRETAATVPEDNPKRAVCLELAEGYERLADLLEKLKHPPSSRSGPER